jgi:hypothetical protein
MSGWIKRAGDFAANVLVVLTICLILFVTLIVYGFYWPKTWKNRVPMTNMRDVERSVGKPLHVTTNMDGTIQWDYTRWWSGTARVYFYTNENFCRIFTEW